MPRHTFHGRRRSLAQLPQLNPTVKYTATYWDASLHDPERLAIDVLRDGLAAGEGRARAANYTAAVGAAGRQGACCATPSRARRSPFAASVIVNASGPWTDLTNLALGDPTSYMGGTKGSHIVLDDPELLAATGGPRAVLRARATAGSCSSTPSRGACSSARPTSSTTWPIPIVCTEDEVDYFLDLIAHVLPEIPVDRSQIVYRFAGVRPLPGHGDVAPGFVSRDYRIEAAAARRAATGRRC